jgi:hypothetical protein
MLISVGLAGDFGKVNGWPVTKLSVIKPVMCRMSENLSNLHKTLSDFCSMAPARRNVLSSDLGLWSLRFNFVRLKTELIIALYVLKTHMMRTSAVHLS